MMFPLERDLMSFELDVINSGDGRLEVRNEFSLGGFTFDDLYLIRSMLDVVNLKRMPERERPEALKLIEKMKVGINSFLEEK
jgi:hypothetical protein